MRQWLVNVHLSISRKCSWEHDSQTFMRALPHTYAHTHTDKQALRHAGRDAIAMAHAYNHAHRYSAVYMYNRYNHYCDWCKNPSAVPRQLSRNVGG